MTNSKATRRALVSSAIALVLCFAMLLGTTFAWFTDTASSNGNTITTGDLDVELYKWTGTTENDRVKVDGASLFTTAEDNKWEPNATNVVYLSIRNEGSLALKYRVVLEVTDVSDSGHYQLTDVLYYDIIEDARYGSVTSWSDENAVQVVKGNNTTQAEDVTLPVNGEHFFALAVHMDAEAGNMYQNMTAKFNITVLAAQETAEEDSFGTTYDEFAGYPGKGFAGPITGNNTATEIIIQKETETGETVKVGSVMIPKAAADPNATGFTAEIKESDYRPNVNIATGMTITPYEVTVTGLKENNDTDVKLMLRVPAGLDPATVKVYHYDTLVDSTYDPNSGYVTIMTKTFSPFTIVYDAASTTPDAPSVEEGENNDLFPKATVVRTPEHENKDLPWGSYGQWSPTEGLDSQLEAAYTFTCDESPEEAEANPYANWYCDFYVMLDCDLGANQIFLGGNYGSFGWVGFHNGDLTLEANTEIPLLGSVTTNPWTYAQVANAVGTFTCGVGDVDDALSGATFTVILRLTNPDNPAEYYDVATINYTFA